MENTQHTPLGDGGKSPGKDPQLWELAQKRASFKYHLATYIVINIFFWILWYLSGQDVNGKGIPWPVWPMFGWGIGLVFHYIGAYVAPTDGLAEREYEKLKNSKR